MIPNSAFVEEVAGKLVWLKVRLDSTVVSAKVYKEEDGSQSMHMSCPVKVGLILDSPGQFSTFELRHFKVDGVEFTQNKVCALPVRDGAAVQMDSYVNTDTGRQAFAQGTGTSFASLHTQHSAEYTRRLRLST